VSVGGDYPLREVDRILGERSEVLWLAGAALAARLGQISVDGTRPPHGRLTPRERECLLRLAAGDRVDRIGERLGISASAVELHLRNARRRLGARTSPEAVAKAILGGLIEP
jgi:DNA-binding CsgD family transcriptional regulator